MENSVRKKGGWGDLSIYNISFFHIEDQLILAKGAVQIYHTGEGGLGKVISQIFFFKFG